MHETKTATPFMMLQDIERRTRAHAAPLPQTLEHTSLWDGIGFGLDERTFIAPISEVSEILHCPELTVIPGAKSWARGVANVRGNLITVIDLAGFFGKPCIAPSRRSRILIINRPELKAGVLVDCVLGLKHFAHDSRLEKVAIPESALVPYIDGEFRDKDTTWMIFSLVKLAQSTKFLNIAA